MSLTNQNGNQSSHIIQNLSSFSLSIPAILPQQNTTTVTNKVIKVLAPIKPTSPTAPFHKGTLITNKNNFGIVNKIIPDSHTPIQIYWWSAGSEKIELKFWYSLDDLRVLKIEPLPLFIPQKTFLIIPAGTLVLTEKGELFQWAETLFWLKEINADGYHLLARSQEWLFPLENFPGIPLACVNELPSRAFLEAANHLNFHQLKTLISLWLSLNYPADILEQLHNNPEIEYHLKNQFDRSEYLQGEDYLQTDKDAAWKSAFSSHLKEQKNAIGMLGFKIGLSTVQSTPKAVSRLHNNPHSTYDYQFGTVVDLEPRSDKPVSILWQHEESTDNYSLPELQQNFISPIVLVKISDQVGYVKSADRKFYQAIVGFASKSVARSWWRRIKKELGHLSDLKPNYHPEIQHLNNQMKAKYFYLAQFPRQKTLNARLRHLQTVANWNLTKHLHR
ncbi:hypothetical protein H6G03_04120 [Planktothrix sp. FACHB-1375]|uniref:Uncharacterized protein n=2 Tax=Cyanophyceae TaxID=3028117 RepID=A0A926VAL5_9CYAN|nr:hypothetical protein [Aerosakkonema funiforme FACHB-1375]